MALRLIQKFFDSRVKTQQKAPQNDQFPQPDPGYVPLPELIHSPLPQILPSHQHTLFTQGWTTLTLTQPPTSDPLFAAYEALVLASQVFFDLPISAKEPFKTQAGSEEGWNLIPGEKEFITLRTSENCPDVLRDAAEKYWAVAGELLNEILGGVAESLGLGREKLMCFSKPCTGLHSEKTATMLRLFRYEGFEGMKSKVVAERMFNISS